MNEGYAIRSVKFLPDDLQPFPLQLANKTIKIVTKDGYVMKASIRILHKLTDGSIRACWLYESESRTFKHNN